MYVLPSVGGFSLIPNLPLTMRVYDEYTSQIAKEIPIGSTDAQGFLTYTGTFDYPWLGRWGINVETPGGLGQSLVAQFHLVINWPTGPIVQAPRPLTVTLWNGDIEAATEFHVGDAWRLVVTGPANQPVFVGGHVNGRA